MLPPANGSLAEADTLRLRASTLTTRRRSSSNTHVDRPAGATSSGRPGSDTRLTRRPLLASTAASTWGPSRSWGRAGALSAPPLTSDDTLP